jgi:hypothetical protein
VAVAAENFPHQSDQFERSFVVDLVVHTVRLFFAPEDPLLPQNRKMLGDIALGRAADSESNTPTPLLPKRRK